MPIIRVDEEVLGQLREIARREGEVFKSPNKVLRRLLLIDAPYPPAVAKPDDK